MPALPENADAEQQESQLVKKEVAVDIVEKESKESQLLNKREVPVQVTCDPQPVPMCASNKEEGGEGTQVD